MRNNFVSAKTDESIKISSFIMPCRKRKYHRVFVFYLFLFSFNFFSGSHKAYKLSTDRTFDDHLSISVQYFKVVL